MRRYPAFLPSMRLACLLAACCFLPGCSYLVYKMDVQQGNFVTQDVVARVKTGMTKAEVRQVLGTPLIADVFHGNRWDYYFSSEKSGRVVGDRTLLSIFFENDKVVSIKGEGRPPKPPAVGQAAPAK
jgi:outer membrane protein assembly factor BamE